MPWSHQNLRHRSLKFSQKCYNSPKKRFLYLCICSNNTLNNMYFALGYVFFVWIFTYIPRRFAAELEATLEAPPVAWAEAVPMLSCRSTNGRSSGSRALCLRKIRSSASPNVVSVSLANTSEIDDRKNVIVCTALIYVFYSLYAK